MTMAPAPPSRRRALALLGAALACPSVLRAGGLTRIAGAAFGTGWQVTACGQVDARRIRPLLDGLFAEIDREMSPWRADSTLSRFNARPAGRMAASGEVVAVTRAALGLARASGGMFDPSVGPLVARWGHGPIGQGRPGLASLGVRDGTIGKTRDDVTLDLCGIAKGRALDRAAALLRGMGCASALIDLGGELRAIGRHPAGRDWQVAVEGPGSAPAAVIRLAPGQSVATSGDAAQGYELAGRRYGHIIDPGRGRPADGGLRSVTVLAGEAMAADGWATALFAAGIAHGPALAETRGVSALFVAGPGSAPQVVPTGAMAGALLGEG